MPKRKLQSTQRKARKKTLKTRAHKSRQVKANFSASRYLGVNLSGGKSDKTSVAVIEYFPSHDKLFLSQLHEKIRTEKEISADLFLHELLTGTYQGVEIVALNAPTSLPLCVTCELECPGFEACGEDHVEWMWTSYRKRKKSKKSLKLFTPYTQRSAEMALQDIIDPPFSIDEAFGSNQAPLSARAHFLLRRMEDREIIETNSRLAVWTIGRALRFSQSHLKKYAHLAHGKESRAYILERILEKDIVFLYQQDIQRLTENLQAFEAFFTALSAFYYSKDQYIPKPSKFPEDEVWPIIPSI